MLRLRFFFMTWFTVYGLALLRVLFKLRVPKALLRVLFKMRVPKALLRVLFKLRVPKALLRVLFKLRVPKEGLKGSLRVSFEGCCNGTFQGLSEMKAFGLRRV